jgi:Alpha-L-fucosidase
MTCIPKSNSLLMVVTLCCSACPSIGLAQTLPAPTIAYGSRTVLIAAEAEIKGTAKLIDMGPGKMGWIQSWDDKSDSVSWRTNVARAGDYEISAIVQSSGENCSIEIAVDERLLHAGCGGQGWGRMQAGTITLTAGAHSIRFASVGATPLGKFYSLEFIRPAVKEQLVEAGRKQRVSTSWMVEAKYGLMFHWTSQSKPQQGPSLSYCDAVRDFDVGQFAKMVSETGAGFVVLTTSHAGFYFPGPNPVIESILHGRTCPRDLVGDMADALNRYHIRLELYFHPGHDDAPWWQRTHFDDDKSAYFQQWRAIISSIGNRYGRKLAGWWFDDAAFTYYPFNPDWAQMSAAARAGNPDRVIAYNSWILPELNDFYDVFAGENAGWETKYEDLAFLPVGGTGRYTGGPQKDLQAEMTVLINGDWGHFKTNQSIAPPRLSADELISKLEDAFSRKAVPLLDVEVYQDGTASPETLQLFQAIRRELQSPPNSAP